MVQRNYRFVVDWFYRGLNGKVGAESLLKRLDDLDKHDIYSNKKMMDVCAEVRDLYPDVYNSIPEAALWIAGK